jgi:hypothetical protein
VGNITENVMHSCIQRLIQTPSDEEAIESLCRLLTTIGKGLENHKNIGIMNSYFQALESLTKENKLPNRIRFMVQDLCDLRKRKWTPRNEPCSSNTTKIETQESTRNNKPVTSTHITKLATKDFGCELKKPPSKTLANTEQGTCDDVTCGFQLDKEMIQHFSKQQQFRPYNIPDHVDQTKPPIPSAGSTKPQIQFASSDVRYRNKPISGYTVTSVDGIDSIIMSESLPLSDQLIVTDKKKEQLGPSAASKSKNKQTTKTISPPTEVTKITKTGQTDSVEKSPRGLVIAEKEVKRPTEKPSSTASPDFVILSSVTEEVNCYEIVVTGIPRSDCGRVIGRAGSNIKRLQEEYGVKLSFFEENLYIFDGDAEGRRAACSDVIENLPVTIECRNLDHTKKVYSTTYFKKLNLHHNVRISRPSPQNQFLTISGTLDRCRTVYQKLLRCLLFFFLFKFNDE